MSSLTGLQSGNFTDIDVLYSIGLNGDTGQNNQVIKSDGTNSSWGDVSGLISFNKLTADGSTITIGGSLTGDYDTTANKTIAVAKVPNAITFATDGSGSRTGTFDGSSAITIDNRDNDNQLNLTEQNGIVITDLGGFNRGIATDIDADTIVFNGTEMKVAKVPNTLTFTGTDTGTFDGSSALTINLTDTNTQLNLTEGNGITITNTGGLNRTITLNADATTLSNNVGSGQAGVLKVPNSLTAGTNISYSSGTTYDGSSAITINVSSSPTNLDLSDTSNIVSPFFFHDVYDPSSLDSDSLTTSYANIFSSNLFNSFTAKQTSCAIELRVYNAQFSTSGRTTYARLNGSSSTSSLSEFTTLYSTGGRDTTRVIHQADESDDVNLTMTWVLTGLTIGNSYNLYPQMRSSTTTNSIYAGGSYPPCILRGYYLPTSSGDDY